MLTYNCYNCHKEFIPHKTSKAKKFCSRSCSNKNRIGQSSWNKGLKGYKAGKEHWLWGKKRPEMIGDKNPNWRGGVTPRSRINQDYIHWRKSVFNRDNYTCQDCGRVNVYLHADHIKSWRDYPELKYALSNGRTLCQACHYFRTYGRKMPSNLAWGVNKKKARIEPLLHLHNFIPE